MLAKRISILRLPIKFCRKIQITSQKISNKIATFKILLTYVKFLIADIVKLEVQQFS